eukprot:gnl/TRDRNA2_/TRDRNA2_156274_c0_seq1.p1 gnl/TRDRNA2_/TRDRNA2_156274_c0~~gnl/TRDRNA2_/TRDRNA2_156274_c0_seq1.p1  ORF type:complete len:222 (-),score=20.36 gnl/TRDRNA2_/TRDRNA2_156274_c0_seq1:7-588(-)
MWASATEVVNFVRDTALCCTRVRRYGGNTEYTILRRQGASCQSAKASLTCTPLGAVIDATSTFEDVRSKLSSIAPWDPPQRTWWARKLEEPWVHFCANRTHLQADELSLWSADLEYIVGYPNSHFAKVDSLRNASIGFFSFFEGWAFVSPPQGMPDKELEKLQVCVDLAMTAPTAAEIDDFTGRTRLALAGFI